MRLPVSLLLILAAVPGALEAKSSLQPRTLTAAEFPDVRCQPLLSTGEEPAPTPHPPKSPRECIECGRG